MPARLKRFENIEPRPLVELDESGAQPFLRCPYCETDNQRAAAECIACLAPLQTADVRAWNAELWAEQSAALREEEARAAGLQKAQLADAIAARAGEKPAGVWERLSRWLWSHFET